ncbi:MAG: hypothetical protein ACT4N2_07460 [Hyphomicrobium sp.]
MGYRGDDLDLRTPQTWSASAADLAGGTGDPRGRPGAHQSGRSGPIWVDETLLACCNHAYDVALINRAGDVRLEHLLHALTRIDAAAEALEARGIRVAALRRDTATVIASDIPIGLPNGKGTPRRSEPFEDVLRQAAAHAARRNGPASVDDLLYIIMDVEPGLPGLNLVGRHLSRHAAYGETASRPHFVPEARVSDYLEPVRSRPQAGSYYFNEPARLPRSEFQGSATDSIQNSRIDALEQMVRALGNDLAVERKAVAGLLHDVQRDLASQRDEASRLGGGLYDRLQAVDNGLERRIGELSRPWAALGDRMHALEEAITGLRTFPAVSPSIDLSLMTDRVAALERTLQTAVADLRSLPIGSGGGDFGPMSERVAALERAVQLSLASGQRHSELLTDKIAALEMALASRPALVAGGQVDFGPMTQRLDMIEEAVLSRETATREISDRLRRLDDSQSAGRSMDDEAQARLLAEIRSLSGLVDREGHETATEVLDSLSARLEGLAGVIEGRHSDTAQALASNSASMAQLIERLAATEAATAGQSERMSAMQSAHTQELGEVHEALMKLNANQHTLAGSIDHWRQDTASTLSVMGSRMETVEREAGRPVALLESMTHTMDRMHRVTVERYYRRNRFWYWLFGTDDWIASSWPVQTARIADDARLARPVTVAKR